MTFEKGSLVRGVDKMLNMTVEGRVVKVVERATGDLVKVRSASRRGGVRMGASWMLASTVTLLEGPKAPKVAASPTGTCQVCFRPLCTPRGLISLHGFQRPGVSSA